MQALAFFRSPLQRAAAERDTKQGDKWATSKVRLVAEFRTTILREEEEGEGKE